MDTGYTYGSPARDRLSVYLPPSFAPPERFTVTRDGVEVVFVRLSDRDLECGRVDGVKGICASFECHREVLGECKCGRHRDIHSDPTDYEDPRPTIQLRRAVP